MTAPTMRTLVPKEFITPLKFLGQFDWLKWEPNAAWPPSSRIELHLPDDPKLSEFPTFIQHLDFIAHADRAALFRLYAVSKTLVSGPKVLVPSAEHCEALKHIDVNVPHAEYEQPFPSIIIELPPEFRKSMTQDFGWPCPRFVLLYHDKSTGYLLSFCDQGSSGVGTMNIISPRPQFKTIEDSLRFDSDEDGPDLRQGEVLQRVACNFGLLLTNYGARECGPFDPKSHAKQVRRSRSRNHQKARRAKALLDASMERIEFRQDVVFFDIKEPSPPNPEASGSTKCTHWRRGHFRKQPCGAGRSQRKFVFIRPCLINGSQFQGDLSDTEYRIHSPSPQDNGPVSGAGKGNDQAVTQTRKNRPCRHT
ncbi:MAG: hypothetical protein NXI28_12455 [bacterium]|nr:hypothetical protein [bacterium]